MKSTRTSHATNYTLYWRRPDEEIDVIELDRKARAATLKEKARRAKNREPLFEKD